MPTRDPHRRIAGIANMLRRRFSLTWDGMADVIQTGWLHYLKLARDDDAAWMTIKEEMRRDIIREIWGHLPHGAQVRGMKRPTVVLFDDVSMSPVDARRQIEARDILQRCIAAATTPRARQTLLWLVEHGNDRGAAERVGISMRAMKHRKMELRRLFKERGLAA